MDKLSEYKKLIISELEKYSTHRPVNKPTIEYQLIIDEKRGQFMLIAVGWHDDDYTHRPVLHLQIKDGYIWVHEDMTDYAISMKLREKGVPKSKIILGSVPEYERENHPNVPA